MSAARRHVVELDVLRGIAALLMIVNHGGYRLLSTSDATTGFVGALVFVGSFAPVVFFFATGFGVALGVNATGRAPAFASTLFKAGLLVVADQMLFWRAGSPWGVNFLGFIGLSALLVSALARFRAAVPICLVAILGLLALRYGIGPRSAHFAAPGSWLGWLFGVHDMNDMPYPPAPWLVYPLAGFVLGRLYGPVRLDNPAPRNRWWATAIAAAVGLSVGAAGLAAAGAVFFRWGTVSVAYFVLSLGVLALAGAVSMMSAAAAPRLAARLALPGVASFAVIPLHYAALEIAAVAVDAPISPWVFLVAIGLIGVACFWASARFSGGMSAWLAGSRASAASLALASMVLLSIGVLLGPGTASPPVAWAAMVVGQLAVAGLLAARSRRGAAGQRPVNSLSGLRP